MNKPKQAQKSSFIDKIVVIFSLMVFIIVIFATIHGYLFAN